MPKLSELKAEAEALRLKYHEAQRRVDEKKVELRKKKQAACPHTKTQQVSEPGYYEVGRSRGPAPDTVYLMCVACKKKLAIQVTEETKKFQPLIDKDQP